MLLTKNLLQLTKGSHTTLHSDLGAVTFVKKHGSKDTIVSKPSLKRIYEKLISAVGL